MAMKCCAGGERMDDQEELYAPQVKQDPKTKERARLLEKTLSSVTPARSVSGLLDEAYVNLEFLDKQSRCASSPRATSDSNAKHLLIKVNSIIPAHQRELAWTQSRKLLEDALCAEQQRSQEEDNDDEYMTEDQRLAQRLKKLDLEMLRMEGDGNCQFRSVSNELYDTQEHHLHVRRKAVAHIRAHREDYECFLGEDFEAYTDQMDQPRTWGDELTLRAICDSYATTIHVVTSEADNWYLKYEPQQQEGDAAPPSREIFLTYIAPIHYNAIRRRSTMAALKTKTLTGLKRLASFPRSSSSSSSRGSKGSSPLFTPEEDPLCDISQQNPEEETAPLPMAVTA